MMTPAEHIRSHIAIDTDGCCDHVLYRPSCPSCDARYERLHGRSES